MSTREVDLFVWHCRPPQGLSLESALANTPPGDDAVAFLFSAAKASIARCKGGKLSSEEGAAGTGGVYEARIFNQAAELRWWHPPELPLTMGYAAYLSENATPPARNRSAASAWTAAPTRHVEAYPNQYLLWGAPDAGGKDVPGWVCLSAARIGRLFAPLEHVDLQQRVVLHSREYVGRAEGEAGQDHGNAVVLDERYLGLGIYEEQRHG